MIEDDERISRFIGNVAERVKLSCLTTSKSSDIEDAVRKFDPDVVLLDPKPRVNLAEKVLRRLAALHTDAAIVLASANSKQISKLESVGNSLGLNMAGVLPEVLDAEILKQELISIFKQAGALSAHHQSTDSSATQHRLAEGINDSETS